MIDYIVSYDWVQFSALGAIGQISVNFDLKLTDCRNKIFNQVWECYQGSELVATIQCCPNSPCIAKRLVVVKIENHILYTSRLWSLVSDIVHDLQLHVISFTRIDIAADFQRLYCGSPEAFISYLFCGEMWRKGARVELFHGADLRKIDRLYTTKHGNKVAYFNSYCNRYAGKLTGYRSGSRSSAVCVYLYNKSLELRQQTDKPYIRKQWRMAGFDQRRDVWRLEFSLKGKAFKQWDMSVFANIDRHTLFLSLLREYFVIQTEAEGHIASVQVFGDVTASPILEKRERQADGTKSAKLFISRCVKELQRQSDSEAENAPAIYDTLKVAVYEYAEQCQLLEYLKAKLAFAGLHDIIADYFVNTAD